MTAFAIFANGTYWGVWSGEDAAAAIQAAADDVGTDGNTDGLIATAITEEMALAFILGDLDAVPEPGKS